MAGLPTTQALVDRDLSALGSALRQGWGDTAARVRVLTLALILYPKGSRRPRSAGVASTLHEYAAASRAGGGARRAEVEDIIDQIALLYPPKGEAP